MKEQIFNVTKLAEKKNPILGQYDSATNIMEVPYYEFNEKVNDDIFRRIFVVDLIKMGKDKAKLLFNNFDHFQMQVGNNVCYNENDKYRRNHKLIFLYNDDLKEIINSNKYNLIHDYNYFVKGFISCEDFKNIKDVNITLSSDNKVLVKDRFINTNGFNLFYGFNGSGKTLLLKEVSKSLSVPIFDVYNHRISEIESSEEFKFYYKLLTGKDNIVRYCGIDNVYYGLCASLAHAKLNDEVVLLDNICWGGIDINNKVNIIDNLNNFSYSNGVVVTACSDTVKKLVKNRVYNPTIINL